MERREFVGSGIRFAALVVCGVLASAGAASAQSGFARFAIVPLAIHSDGKVHHFKVELALSGRQHSQGLMLRRHIAKDAGMLFVYWPARQVMMWMKNTYISLDMLFIGPDGTIVHIVERTVPLSTETISSGVEVVGVLELKAGVASRLGLKRGDKVTAEALSAVRP